MNAPVGKLVEAERLDVLVPGLRCAGCLTRVEAALNETPGVVSARINLSQKRAAIRFRPDETSGGRLMERLEALGYPARPYDRDALEALDRDPEGRALLMRIGVAAFAAMNVMLLSVAVWSGADGATRTMLQWISALIAVPAVAWAGLPFYRGALDGLRARQMRMDLPISVAIWLAVGVSLAETAFGSGEAWFEASTALVLFLLIGRWLDHRMRRAARSAAAELAELRVRTVERLTPNGGREAIATELLEPGDRIAVSPGDRIAADGVIEDGRSSIDRALVTGESVPEAAGPGDTVHAGMLNLDGALTVRVTATGNDTLLSEIERMIGDAEAASAGTPRLADRAVALYAPGVHLIALLAALGWLAAGAPASQAVLIAAATLIITCPCALGLAIPAVQAAAGGRLFASGVFLKDGAALEALARADTVVFDKTGTLTEGKPQLVAGPVGDEPWAAALALALSSRHPLARALARSAETESVRPSPMWEIREVPGSGVEGMTASGRVRLGRGDWVGADDNGDRSAVWLAMPERSPVAFTFEDRVRPDAAEAIAALKEAGLDVMLLSGDRAGPVEAAARAAGIDEWRAGVPPEGKLDVLARLRADGRQVVMVGDGLNDAPALAAADCSISPADAAEVAQASASLVFVGERLMPVVSAFAIARAARRRMVENLWLAGLYNAVAIPLAVAGYATPLIAAIAMSSSSILVTLNAARMRWAR